MPLLYRALSAVRDTVAGGGRVLFVGTKRQATEKIAEAAKRCGQHYVNHRWLGGMMTNWKTISVSMRRLKELEEQLGDDEENLGLTKKELLRLTRERDKLERALGGIKEMGGLPDILFVIDTNKEHIAVPEANKLGIPVIAGMDTNSDPAGNTPPVAAWEGWTERRVRGGAPLTLVMKAGDDGIPGGSGFAIPSGGILNDDGELNLAAALRRQPMLVVPGKANGLHVSWFVYRGPGEVTFDPLQISVWEDTRPYSNSPWSLGWVNPDPPEDGRWVVQATFHEPGTYVLRGLVDDGGLSVYHDVTVVVTPLTL